MKQDTTELRLTFINVGYGEAILIDAPDAARPDGRFYALIDGGSAADSEFADRTSGRIRAEEYLAPLPRLDLRSARISTRIISAVCSACAAIILPLCCGRPCRPAFTARFIRSATPPRAICPSAIFSRRSMTIGSCALLSGSTAAASSRAFRMIR